jgi:anti-anti-sigma factor
MTIQAADRTRNDVAFSVQIDGRARLVALAGELDAAAVPLLVEGLARLGEPGDIIIDLAELTFIDAAGLGATVQARNSQLANGFDLGIVHATRFVTRVFSLGGLDQLLCPTPRRDTGRVSRNHDAAPA